MAKKVTDKEEWRASVFGVLLDSLRRHADITVKELFTRAGMSQPAVSNILSGRNTMSFRSFLRLAEALEIRPSNLLELYEQALEVCEGIGDMQRPSKDIRAMLARSQALMRVHTMMQEAPAVEEEPPPVRRRRRNKPALY